MNIRLVLTTDDLFFDVVQFKNSKGNHKYYFNMITPEVCPPRELLCEVKYGGKTFNLAGLSRVRNFYAEGDDGDQ